MSSVYGFTTPKDDSSSMLVSVFTYYIPNVVFPFVFSVVGRIILPFQIFRASNNRVICSQQHWLQIAPAPTLPDQSEKLIHWIYQLHVCALSFCHFSEWEKLYHLVLINEQLAKASSNHWWWYALCSRYYIQYSNGCSHPYLNKCISNLSGFTPFFKHLFSVVHKQINNLTHCFLLILLLHINCSSGFTFFFLNSICCQLPLCAISGLIGHYICVLCSVSLFRSRWW